ncbi:MAG: SDR family oxidoreductase [Nocardioides sp.]|uniref:SDR family NAD(P)-dependent oxidoreductase n=1 Tax=Nocardioides sp. TaxID=35761 RepID=UPI0039E30AE6
MPHPDFGFDRGDVVLITGAASGIGRQLVLRAVELGLRVSAWDLTEAGLLDVAAQARDAGGEVMTYVADVSDHAATAVGFERTLAELGPIRYLANNAGPSSAAPLEFEDAIRICIGSVRAMTEAWAATGLPEGAAMVATSSVAGNRIGTESDWYSASKAALMGYVRHLAAHRAASFRSNAVAPGMTDTPRLAGFAGSEIGQRALARNPLGRMATADDIAWAELFLLSPLASYINGVLLPVDGGWTVTQ